MLRLPLPALLMLCACDPTASRLTAKRLEFTFAAHTRSFDLDGNLVLTGFGTPQLVRMNRTKQEFQDLSQGLPANEFPSGEVFADTAGNLAAGGWYRAATADAWVKLPAPPTPKVARVFTFDGAGIVYAVLVDRDVFELYRLTPPDGAWERLATLTDPTNLESAVFHARLDGTVFVKDRVWVKGASELAPLLKCPTTRIDQACERGFDVFTHPRRNETYLAAATQPGISKGKLFKLPAGATFPVEYDSLKEIEVTGTWLPVRESSDGVLHVAALQEVSLDYPPYMAKEATLSAVTDVARPEARLLWSSNKVVVGDHHDIYQATAQLSGGSWSADPVYVWTF